MITYQSACETISKNRGESVCITTMTQSGTWNRQSDKPELDISIGNGMSKASSVGLGIALGCPKRKVMVLDGDGSLLMNLGSLVTVAGKKPKNFIHFVFNNAIYAVVGGQPLPMHGKIDYCGIAIACGYLKAVKFKNSKKFEHDLPDLINSDGPIFIEIESEQKPALEGVDQTWASNRSMPLQMRSVRKKITQRDDWGPGGPFL